MLTAIDANLEQLPWTVVIDPSVNKVLPKAYEAVNTPDGLASYIIGPAWSGALAKLERPLIPGCFRPSLLVSVCPDSATVTNAQALEFDVRFQLYGMNYNRSAQINYAQDGMLQVADAKGGSGWADTGCKVGKLTPNQWTDLRFDFQFDTAAKRSSTTMVTVGGIAYVVPTALQNVVASPLNWQDGIAVIQIQMDLNGNGGACSHKTKVSLNWQ